MNLDIREGYTANAETSMISMRMIICEAHECSMFTVRINICEAHHELYPKPMHLDFEPRVCNSGLGVSTMLVCKQSMATIELYCPSPEFSMGNRGD